MIAYSLLNHIQGKNGSRWPQFVRETGTEHMLMMAIDAAKYTHKTIICTFYGDILVQPFEFDAVTTVSFSNWASVDKSGRIWEKVSMHTYQ